MRCSECFFFFFNDTATTEIYTLSLHDALPICRGRGGTGPRRRPEPSQGRSTRAAGRTRSARRARRSDRAQPGRSEEHTSELQSRQYLVCRLLLEKKKQRSFYTLMISDYYYSYL